MKRKRHSRRRRAIPRAAAPRRRRRHYSSNPLGIAKQRLGFSPKALISSVIHGAMDAGVGVIGLGGARLARGKMGLEGNTIKGSLVEIGVGIAGAPLAARFLGEDVGRAFMQGVLMGPLMTGVKSLNVPILAPALGDEGELPLFGGLYDLGGVYDVGPGANVRRLNGGNAGAPGVRVALGDVGDVGEGGMM